VADKKPMVVIKKITVVAGGGHGGAWKVAFADFMTAMMAFFLVMWLVSSSSEEQKKAISDYFSTPSVIEYQFSNFGVELTLEKLFLDLVNEPLNTLQTFMNPMDKTPNIMAMGMKKVVMAYMTEQVGGFASEMNVTADTVSFEISDEMLFEKGTTKPSAQYMTLMDKLKGATSGLEDSEIVITTVVYKQSVPGGDAKDAKNVADERFSMVQKQVKEALESPSVDVRGRAVARDNERAVRGKSGGYFKFELKQKSVLPDGRKPKPLNDGVFGTAQSDKSVYDNFVKRVSDQKNKKRETQEQQAPQAPSAE
jgi:chemotaxis protein MotB